MNYFTYPGLPISDDDRKENIIEKVCNYFHTNHDALKSKHRGRRSVYARQICMYALRKKTGFSQEHIGKLFGGRDHTTVIHSIQTIDNLLFSDPNTRIDLVQLGLID